MEDAFNRVDDSLELFVLEKTDLSLEVSIFISMLEEFRTVGSNEEYVVKLWKNILANSLVSTPIQDSSKRKKAINKLYCPRQT